MEPKQAGGVWSDRQDGVPGAFEGELHSGRLADQIVGSRLLNGCADLVLALIDLGDEAPLTRSERLREAGRWMAHRLFQRLSHQLESEWQCDDVASLPWEQFALVISQASERFGFGALDLRVDEAAGVVHVVAWSSPFPELIGGSEPACAVIEGFAATLIEAVGGGTLASRESTCRAAGAVACQFELGSEQALRQLPTNG